MCYHERLKAEADARIQLFLIMSNIKEIGRNVKRHFLILSFKKLSFIKTFTFASNQCVTPLELIHTLHFICFLIKQLCIGVTEQTKGL